jgi:alginate O-acetyltransferase complex protein AlgI
MLLYAIAPGVRHKNFVLIFLSLFFYAWGEPIWVVLLVFSATSDYFLGILLDRFRGRIGLARAVLIISLTINLSLLGTFKYLDFFLENLGLLMRYSPALPGLALPIGISFYTFQTMSYIIDVYKGKVAVQRSYAEFLLFVSLFPQLVAGPILRYSEMEKQLRSRPFTWENCAEGITRFCCGLAKKVLLANTAGEIANGLLDGRLDTLPAADAWLGMLMFAAQIYYDFSGYSDMAIGLGKMIGFDFKENFNYPYTAKSVTDFWRRWHMSLSLFFRDYIYIPMGGNRRFPIRNLIVVWFVTGLWHGASFNFIFWGLYYCVALIIEKYLLKDVLARVPVVLARFYSLLIVLFGWLIFYYTDLAVLGTAAAAFFGFAETFVDYQTTVLFFSNIWILPILALFSTTIPQKLFEKLRVRLPVIEPVFTAIVLCFSVALLVGQSFNPFLYFRF